MSSPTAKGSGLSPSDKKTYRRVRAVPVRSPDETVLTINIPKELKGSLLERREKTERPVSSLVRWAIEFQEATGWRHLPKALTVEETMSLARSGWKFPHQTNT